MGLCVYNEFLAIYIIEDSKSYLWDILHCLEKKAVVELVWPVSDEDLIQSKSSSAVYRVKQE